MSQSATWDALRLAADFRAWDRDKDAAHVMPEPEVAWVRSTRSARYPAFYEREQDSPWDDPEPSRGEQICEHRMQWDRHDWFAWMEPLRPLNLSAFDPMIREHYTPRDGFVFTIGDTNGQAARWANDHDAFRREVLGEFMPSLPRRNLTAALTALHGYRWPHG